VSAPLGIGVLGSTSTVARMAVIPAIRESSGCELVATASLSDTSAASNPEQPAAYDTYEALLDDARVEAVYIPLPNSMHLEWVERCARAGKHVLCEKPLAITARDAVAMVDACESAGVVLMEAYMTPFHPRHEGLIRRIRDGEIGEYLFATAAFTGVLDRPDDHRWRPEMGGGALLDVGIYCLSPILAAAQVDLDDASQVRAVNAAAHRAPLGVDAGFSGWLDFGEGRTASFQCSFEAPERQLLEIVGTSGAMRIERPFTPSVDDREIHVRRLDGSEVTIVEDAADPYLVMVEHFASVVRGEADRARPLHEVVGLARLVDRLTWAAEPGSS
jgi:predicted dehydrogenase